MAISTKEDLNALTAEDIKPTEAHVSLAKFLTENLPVEVSPEQAFAFIIGHRVWQSGPERAAEKEALKIARSGEAEARKAANAEKAEARKQEAAAKKAAAEAKKAAKAAKDAEDDSDLEDNDNEDSTDEAADAPAPKRRRKGKAATTPETGEF